MHSLRIALVAVITLVASVGMPHASAEVDASLLAALKRGDYVILLRHAETDPGIGDPPGYKLDNCATQRNLSAAGRAQARAWGEAVTRNSMPIGGVFSSVWCRCVDTAKLAFGKSDTWPALNSHFDRGAADLQTEQVRGGIAARMVPGKNLVLVTHQVNITALTGKVPSMGEAVVARVAPTKDKSALPTLDVIGMMKLP
jgi:broad specificity phosphatase PhoE